MFLNVYVSASTDQVVLILTNLIMVWSIIYWLIPDALFLGNWFTVKLENLVTSRIRLNTMLIRRLQTLMIPSIVLLTNICTHTITYTKFKMLS